MALHTITATRFTADGSIGTATVKTLVYGAVYNTLSDARAVAHIRSGSIAGGIRIPYQVVGTAAKRAVDQVIFAEPLEVRGKVLVEVSGASTVCTVFHSAGGVV